jgi:hypothetical protein
MPAKTEGERYMRAYFHTFTPTGDDKVDAILEAVALAGKAFHHTMDWSEAEEYGPAGYWDLIQQRANEAARAPDAAPAGEPAAEQKATLKITLEWDDDDGPLEIVAHGTLRDMHYLDARLKFLHSLERATPPRGEADERAMFEAYWSSLASDGSESETERLNAYHAGWNAWSARAALRADERAISASGETKG